MTAETAPPCVFDRILDGSVPGHVVLDEVTVAAFLDVRPVFKGHVLVVPRVHIETVAELPGDLLGDLMGAGRRVAGAQRQALGCTGTFFALNDVVSQSVPHVHLHVIPRNRGDGLRGFLWPRTRYGDDREAASIASGIREALAVPASSAGTAPLGDVSLREARPEDAPAIARLLAGGSLRGSEDASNPAVYAEALRDIRSGTNSVVLVAEVDGRVVGTCQLIWFRHLQERGGLCAEIESMHVEAGCRGKGVGGILLDAAVARARDLGCYRIQLTSNRSRKDAHRFYERHGFEPSHVGFKRYLS